MRAYGKRLFFLMALLSAMLFCFDAAFAQVTDTLSEVRIKAKRKRRISNDDRIEMFSPGQKVMVIDSLILRHYQYQTMASLLAQQAPVFVRSYGFNNLATLNFRGSSAAQSQVYWNGVPLLNAASGMADISLLPVAMIDKVNIVYGGSSALWGSGNVGGALMIENNLPAFDSNGTASHSISAVGGSFQQYQLGLKSAFSTEKLAFAVTAFGQTAENRFPYTDQSGTTRSMDNSRLQSGALIAEAAYKLNPAGSIKLTGWYQQYYREIPRALFETQSQKNQRDESIRVLAEWRQQQNKNSYHAKAAWMTDYMLYSDEQILLQSDNVTNQFFAEAGVQRVFNAHHRLLLFAPVHLSWMKAAGQGEVKWQKRLALATAYAFTGLQQKLNISASFRGELIDEKPIFLPGINASYALTDWLMLRANLQRSYRAPTLNELYYSPGGNPQLKPERGWSRSAGYRLRLGDEDRLSLVHDASLFDRSIEDWIIWFGGAIWTPHNIATVNSRGVETENRLSYAYRRWRFHLRVNTAYVLATTQSSYLPNDGSIGRQIPYTPRYNGQVNVGFSFKSFYANYNHTYTGYRFITADESQYINPYTTGNLQLLYTHLVQVHPIQFSLQINNIWQEEYAVVNGRPMPGVNWLAGIRFSLR